MFRITPAVRHLYPRLLLAGLLTALPGCMWAAAVDAPAAGALRHTRGGACGEVYTPAYVIQGRGEVTSLAGREVTTQGVVVADQEGAAPALRGFYLQDADGDGDAATSDAVFVFNGDRDDVSVGDVVRVSGRVGEFHGQTQVSASAVARCGRGTLAPAPIVLPLTRADMLEAREGMLVTVPQTLHVTGNRHLGRFGQVTVSAHGRLMQPTDVVAPGDAARALQARNELARLIVDDHGNALHPDPIAFGRGGRPLSAANTLRSGDTVAGLTGVLTWTRPGSGADGPGWRIRPLGALGGAARFDASNPRPAVPPQVGGTLRVAAINVLNYFNTFDDGDAATPGCFPSHSDRDCRGARSASEFERQAAKTVAAIAALDADVVGLVEMENDGYGPDSSLHDLVGRLNAAHGRQSHALLDIDARTGRSHAAGGDAIRVAIIYRPARLRPVGVTAVLDAAAFVNGGDGVPRNRPALAQAFEDGGGGRFVLVMNHFKSKGSTCDAPPLPDGEGECSAVRLRAARQLLAWLGSDPTRTGEQDVLVMGDLNAYAMEAPVQAFVRAGYTDLVGRDAGTNGYTYGFDGQWGRLDHALASPSLARQVSRAAVWHVSADEPDVLDYTQRGRSAAQRASLYSADVHRNSDHDPVIVGLDLADGVQATCAPDSTCPPGLAGDER